MKRARDMYAAGYFYGEIDKVLRRPRRLDEASL
jgi:hypothetical protein